MCTAFSNAGPEDTPQPPFAEFNSHQTAHHGFDQPPVGVNPGRGEHHRTSDHLHRRTGKPEAVPPPCRRDGQQQRYELQPSPRQLQFPQCCAVPQWQTALAAPESGYATETLSSRTNAAIATRPFLETKPLGRSLSGGWDRRSTQSTIRRRAARLGAQGALAPTGRTQPRSPGHST